VGAKDIVIESNDGRAHKRRTVAKDGERQRMQAPFQFRVVNDALHVLVPAGQSEAVR
jgi:diacylglycerol kinase family enzyme